MKTYKKHGKIYKVKEKDLEICPNCGRKSVRAKEMSEGGGVECIYCEYWFCY